MTASSLGKRRPISKYIVITIVILAKAITHLELVCGETLYIFNSNKILIAMGCTYFYPHFPEKETGSERLSYLLGFSYQGPLASTAYALNPRRP